MSMKNCFDCGKSVCIHEKWTLTNPNDKIGTCDNCGEPCIHHTVPVKDGKIVYGDKPSDSKEPVCNECFGKYLKKYKIKQWFLKNDDGTIDESEPNLDAINLKSSGITNMYHEVGRNPQNFIKK